MARDLASFLERFALPLLRGGELHIGAPIRQSEAAAWQSDLDRESDLQQAIHAARAHNASQWIPATGALHLSAADLNSCIGLHNILLLQHPDVRSQTRQLGLSELALSQLVRPATSNARELVARHTLYGRALMWLRRDIDLQWWSGHTRYVGQAPPARLRALPSLRRVLSTVNETSDLLPPALMRVILRQSPLSWVAGATGTSASLSGAYARREGDVAGLLWLRALPVLRAPDLVRRVLYDWMSVPLGRLRGWGDAFAEFAHTAEPCDVRCAAAFVTTLFLYRVAWGAPAVAEGSLAADAALCAVPTATVTYVPWLRDPPGFSDGEKQRWRAWLVRAGALHAESSAALGRAFARAWTHASGERHDVQSAGVVV